MNKQQHVRLKTPANGSIQPWLVLLLLLVLLAFFGYWNWIKSPSTTAETTAQDEPVVSQPIESEEFDTASEDRQTIFEPEVPMTNLQDVIEEQGHISITGQPIDTESLAAKKAQIISDAVGQKKPINPGTMDPLMLLEYAQFGRYLDLGQFDLADELLTEMQENWPEYDFEDMIFQLALAESQSDQPNPNPEP